MLLLCSGDRQLSTATALLLPRTLFHPRVLRGHRQSYCGLLLSISLIPPLKHTSVDHHLLPLSTQTTTTPRQRVVKHRQQGVLTPVIDWTQWHLQRLVVHLLVGLPSCALPEVRIQLLLQERARRLRICGMHRNQLATNHPTRDPRAGRLQHGTLYSFTRCNLPLEANLDRPLRIR
jgi:hypothetical protein